MAILAVLTIITGSVFFFAWLNVSKEKNEFSCVAGKTESKPVGSFTTFEIKNIFGVEKSLGKALLVEKIQPVAASTQIKPTFIVESKTDDKEADEKTEKTDEKNTEDKTQKKADEKTEDKTQKPQDKTDNKKTEEKKKPQTLKEILEDATSMKSQDAFIAAAKELGVKMVAEKVSDSFSVLYRKGDFESFYKEMDAFKAHDYQADYWNAKLQDGPFLLIQVASDDKSFI